MSKGDARGSVTRAEIEEKLREIRDETAPGGDGSPAPSLAAGSVAAAVAAAYLLGRRSGRKRRTVVEIRRRR
jgi:hypothetical protein